MLSWITAKFPLLDAEGEVWAVGGVCTDITSRKRQPGARAVVVSGYAEEPCMADPRGAGFAAALAKPFGPDKLRAALAPLLPAARGRSGKSDYPRPSSSASGNLRRKRAEISRPSAARKDASGR